MCRYCTNNGKKKLKMEICLQGVSTGKTIDKYIQNYGILLQYYDTSMHRMQGGRKAPGPEWGT